MNKNPVFHVTKQNLKKFHAFDLYKYMYWNLKYQGEDLYLNSNSIYTYDIMIATFKK